MKIKIVPDNARKFHLEFYHDDDTPMIPREGFESVDDAFHVIDNMQMEAYDAEIMDMTSEKIFQE